MLLFKKLSIFCATSISSRIVNFSTKSNAQFGLVFDIDGVIVRGKNVIPEARSAFQMLTNESGEFKIPTTFVTNSGSTTPERKAKQLSEWLNVKVDETQVIVAHTPLRMFKQFHHKHILLSGQGPLPEIAESIGFTNVSYIEDVRSSYPLLDVTDHHRREKLGKALRDAKPRDRIDALVLTGEPVHFETSLQLIIDLLMTDGYPPVIPAEVPHPHIPILVCNMDFLWKSETESPRLGHGAFLVALEALYNKVTGMHLDYTALIGKPSEITYFYAEQELQRQAEEVLLLDNPVKNIYCVGDNLCTDIIGANLFHNYLNDADYFSTLPRSRCANKLLGLSSDVMKARTCSSVLVETGVHSTDHDISMAISQTPKEFHPIQQNIMNPKIVADDVLRAIEKIFVMENYV